MIPVHAALSHHIHTEFPLFAQANWCKKSSSAEQAAKLQGQGQRGQKLIAMNVALYLCHAQGNSVIPASKKRGTFEMPLLH